jgi:hypothetical protein
MRSWPNITHFLLGLGALGTVSLGCRSSKEPTSETHSAAHPAENSDTSKGSRTAPDSRARAVKTHFSDETSAYAARIFSRGDETIVVTPTSLFRARPDEKVIRHEVNIGHLSARLEDSIVFFREGMLRALSLDNLEERVLIRLDKQPQVLMTEGPRLAWLVENEVVDNKSAKYSIRALSAGSARLLYASQKELSVPVLHNETVYFVERAEDGWKLGRIPLDGSQATFGESRQTRTPAMLAAGLSGIYFYDGLKRGVRKVSFDLLFEEAVNEEAICAPLAVSSRVVCAQVGGVVDIPRSGAPPRIVASELSGPIAALAANDTKAFWIADSGENQLTVRSASLPAL